MLLPRQRLRMLAPVQWGLAAVCAVVAATALALNPDRNLKQYNCQTWTRQQGLPAAAITGITQTADGAMWFGTSKGLMRFDGVTFSRTEVMTKADRRTRVSAVVASPSGLWVGLETGGFGTFDGRAMEPWATKDWSGAHLEVRALLGGTDGSIWIGADPGVVRIDPATHQHEIMLRSTDAEAYNVYGLSQDRSGRVWAGTVEQGIFYWQNGIRSQLRDAAVLPRIIHAVGVDNDGQLWVGTNIGLLKYDRELRLVNISFEAQEIRAILVDRSGAVWIGATLGLYRVWHGEVQSIGQPEGLSGAAITALFEDREGSLWIGTRDGLSCLTDIRFPIFPATTIPARDEAFSVAPSSRGGVWVAHSGGLTYFDAFGATYFDSQAGLSTNIYKRVYEAGNGDVYAVEGTKILVVMVNGKVVRRVDAPSLIVGLTEDAKGVVVSVGGHLMRADRERLTPYEWRNGEPPLYWVFDLLAEPDGSFWVASANGVFRVKDGEYRRWGTEQGLGNLSVQSLARDQDGILWLGTPSGLGRLQGDRVKMIGREDGLFDEYVCGIASDDRGGLWVDSGDGVSWMSRAEIADFCAGKATHVRSLAYDGPNSVQTSEKLNQERTAAKSADGRVWLPTARGVLVIDPAHVPTNTIPPPVHIDAVRVNGLELPRASKASIPPGRTRLEFQFSAMSFIAPQKIVFRYKLEGYDEEWITETNRREVAYSNLEPGRYAFHVAAANADGVWNETGDTFAVELQPYFYQTVWFRVTVGVLFFAGIGGVYGIRVRHLQRRADELQRNRLFLEAEVQRRTAQLEESNTALQHEVEERRVTELQLVSRTEELEREIGENKRMQREVERIHRELLEVSRHAGMAEVATGVLHNVGNVLNSVNVSAAVVIERMQRSKIPNVARLGALLKEHSADLPNFLLNDHRGQQVVTYVQTLAEHLSSEQSTVLEELEGLRKNISHINEIVAMQQAHATAAGIVEKVAIVELVEDALKINASAIDRHGLTLIRDFQANPTLNLERHKVMQILINVIRNAKYACDETGRPDKRITVRITTDAQWARIAIIDNGVGIATENLTRIFSHGFTTRKKGHGFGLHSSAIAARELGGTLTAHSEGRGHGATFILELPLAGAPG